LTPEFWTDYFKNLTDYIVMVPNHIFEVNHIGLGGPPIETDRGWLLVYHAVEETPTGTVTHAKAALLQIDKPEIEIARLSYPLFSPSKDWEIRANGEGIVTPTGHALFGNDLYIYYGCAKRHTAVAKINLDELVEALLSEP
ncbi:MAG TPA: hypothetical protein VLR29_05285, partial [Flavobacterium sp.]|nr:hypothetical protein [Flavobacterium sp.]